MKTHTDITSPHIRLCYARELLVTRHVIQRCISTNYPMSEDAITWYKYGIDTAYRRWQHFEIHGTVQEIKLK